MKALKTIAALAFITAIGVALVQPVLRADDGGGGAAVQSPSPTPSEAPSDGVAVTLTARYPKRCMRRAEPSPLHYVAARRGRRAVFGLPEGRPVATAEVEGDVAWSPSGSYLAENGGRVVDQRGTPKGSLFFRPVEWQWSPVADCALAITERGNLTYSVPGTKRRGVRLLDAPVQEFDLSPNGRRLAFVVEGRGLWIADLRARELVHVRQREAFIYGWFSNSKVLYSPFEGEGTLRFATGTGDTGRVRNAYGHGTPFRCASRFLVYGGLRSAAPALSEIVARRGKMRREILASGPVSTDGYSGASCSPDGGFIAASGVTQTGDKGPLVLLDADGSFVQRVVGGRTANPTWAEDGIVFVRFGNGGRARLWHIAPAATGPTRTRYRVGAPTQYDWHTG